jgi:hypothetical protein
MRPNAASVSATIRRTLSWLVTSPATVIASPPAAFASAATFSASALLLL